jgi:hypothetical protein
LVGAFSLLLPRISSEKPNRQFQREYVEHVSGGKGKEQRPQFAAMLDDAHRRQFDIDAVKGFRYRAGSACGNSVQPPCEYGSRPPQAAAN